MTRNMEVLIARSLRRKQTEVEGILWKDLRNRKLLGKKFLRQHPIIVEYSNKNKFYVADFYCSEAKLVIEIDGPIHYFQREYDRIRSDALEEKGLRVLRFSNEEVKNNKDRVIEMIKKEVSKG